MLWLTAIHLFVIVPACLLAANQLVSVHFVWRHGERAPLAHINGDPNNESAWAPAKYGELTERGKQQQFCLGRRIRAYCNQSDLLPTATPDPTEIHARSTNKSRTIESAKANFNGFYGAEKGHPEVLIHTPFVNECSERDVPISNTSEYKSLSAAEAPLLERLTKMVGAGITLANVIGLLDVQKIEQETNKPHLPPWQTEEAELNSAFSKLWRWNVGLDLQPTADVKDWLKARTGPYAGEVLWTIVNDMTAKVDCNVSVPGLTCEQLAKVKYFAISAHDSTISALLSALQLNTTAYDPTPLLENLPNLNSALVFEQWKKDGSNGSTHEDFHITVNYWFGSTDAGNCTIETGASQKTVLNETFPSFLRIADPYLVDHSAADAHCAKNTTQLGATFEV